jgi:hypothetical protein
MTPERVDAVRQRATTHHQRASTVA